MEDARALIKKRRAFIKENYKEWNFFNAFCLTTEYPERPIRFFFEFRESSGGYIFDLINILIKNIAYIYFIILAVFLQY